MAAIIPLLPQLYLTIGGSEVPGDLSQAISKVEVDLHLYLPDMFVIEVHDEGFRWVEHSLVKVGQQVEIAVRASEDEQRASASLLSGEIVSIEAAYPETGVPTLTIRGYDLSHRLHRGRPADGRPEYDQRSVRRDPQGHRRRRDKGEGPDGPKRYGDQRQWPHTVTPGGVLRS